MANWCETYLTFQDNGAEQGRQALYLIYILQMMNGCYLDIF